MNSREKLQYCYELAFFSPRLNEAWRRLKAGEISDRDELGELLDMALLLHQALPSDGYASQRALNRLALYQAKARATRLSIFDTAIKEGIPLAAVHLPFPGIGRLRKNGDAYVFDPMPWQLF